tara:strand:- start:749 stop:1726 length:978 start_codon:yes stop_codon:yes gene_type:complete
VSEESVPTSTDTPVALFIFNRPDKTKRVAQAIFDASPSKLLVVADGPRPGRLEDFELCDETRAVIESFDWQCEVVKNYSSENFGCRLRVATGLDWVFSEVEEAIILEDDCLPHPSFFPYCDELLRRYRDDTRIHMISGNNMMFGQTECAESYYFSRFYKIWGWASWARAWRFYDLEMTKWPDVRYSSWLGDLLPTKKMAAMAHNIFDETYSGNLTTWEYQWVFASWLQRALAIVPRTNLIANIGFGEDATHMMNERSALASLDVEGLDLPLIHPAEVEVDEKADLKEWNILYGRAHSWRRHVPRVLRAKLRALRRSFGFKVTALK